MRKQVFGRHLKRDINERKALFKGLASSLVVHERIETTEAKAKAIRAHVEKLVTKARMENKLHAEGLLQPYLSSSAVKKMITDVAPRFATRPGGYTRIVKIGQRFSDNAPMVYIEWVEKSSALVTAISTKKTVSKEKEKDVVEATVVGTEDKKTASKPKTKSLKKPAVKKTAKKDKTV